MPGATLTGGCLCGAVRFEVDGPLVSASYCHCTRCRRQTGAAASAQAETAPAALRLVAGAELVRAWRRDNGWLDFFCSTCGSPLWSAGPTAGSVQWVHLGALDGDPGIRPQWRQFVAYAAPWEPIPDDGLPRFPEARPT